MKKFLHLVLSLCIISTLNKVAAQGGTSACSISDIVISDVRQGTLPATAGQCAVSYDVTFTIDRNNGSKYVYAASYLSTDYANYFQCGTPKNGAVKAPNKAELGNPFQVLALDLTGAQPAALFTYFPDETVPVNTYFRVESAPLSTGNLRVTIRGIQAVVPVPCGSPIVIVTDIFGTQGSERSNSVHCYSCNVRFSSGYLDASIQCPSPNTYSVTIRNISNIPIAGNYTLYADVNMNRILAPVSEGGADIQIAGGATGTIQPGQSITLTGPLTDPSTFGTSLFLQFVHTTGGLEGVSRLFTLTCPEASPLPVSLKAFTAARNGRNVLLSWETASEANSKGFDIERRDGTGSWTTIGFVASQAANGNSSQPLRYQYTDANVSSGTTQYRLKQVDLNSSARYSDVRLVRGLEQKTALTVYPNPSTTGTVSILMDKENVARDIQVIDYTGRIVKEFRSVSSNQVRIDNLVQGSYVIRVTDKQSGEVSSEKVMVRR
jgi:hypothetical protein